MDRIYAYDEPAPFNGNARVSRTREEVISYMKHIHPETTLSDEELINEYMTVYWAWIDVYNESC